MHMPLNIVCTHTQMHIDSVLQSPLSHDQSQDVSSLSTHNHLKKLHTHIMTYKNI